MSVSHVCRIDREINRRKRDRCRGGGAGTSREITEFAHIRGNSACGDRVLGDETRHVHVQSGDFSIEAGRIAREDGERA